MDGSMEEVTAAADSNVLDLKQIVASRRNVPWFCYEALLNSEIIKNLEKLSSLIEDDNPQNLMLAMVVSMNEIREMLSSASASKRMEALDALKTLGPKGGDEAYQVALRFAQDFNRERVVAMEALASVAPRKDEQAGRVIAERVLDRNKDVRDAAPDSLVALSDGDFMWSASVIFSALEGGVREQVPHATDALVKMACLEECSVAVLVSLIDTASDFALVPVVSALALVASEGDEKAISALSELSCQHHRDISMLCSATTALSRLAKPGDERLLLTLLECFENGDAEVKFNLLNRAKHKVPKDNDLVIQAVCSQIASPSADLRKLAAEALPKMVTIGNEYVIDALSKILQNEAWGACFVVVKLMPSIVEVGDARAINALKLFLDHPQPMLQRAAIESLRTLGYKE